LLILGRLPPSFFMILLRFFSLSLSNDSHHDQFNKKLSKSFRSNSASQTHQFFKAAVQSTPKSINATINRTSFSFIALPFSIPCQFWIHPRQHVAVACWAMNTGCPLIGVCLPSFFGTGCAILEFIKSQTCF